MLSFALRNLWTRPMRSALALCGLTVAIMGMVGLFSVAEGIQNTVTSTFNKIPGLVIMQPGAPIPLFSRIPTSWGDEIRTLPNIHAVNPEVWTRAHLIEGKPTISPPRFLFGVDIERCLQLRHGVYRDAVKKGRFFEPADRGTFNAVISQPIAEEFKKEIGDKLEVDGAELTIVGVYECGSLLLDVAIIMDINHVRSLGRIGSDSVSSFYIEPESEALRDQVRDEIKTLFRGRSLAPWQPASLLGEMGVGAGNRNPVAEFFSTIHKAAVGAGSAKPKPSPLKQPAEIPPVTVPTPESTAPESTAPENDAAAKPAGAVADDGKPPPQPVRRSEKARNALPIEVRSADEWAEEFKRFSADLEIFLLIMTSIGVTIAVLGIINTMLMSVTERFIEFGILKANGWSSGDVLRLITFESALLGVAGGVLGAALGWCATLVINAQWPTRIHLYASPQLLVFGLFFSTVVGILSGLYPALWASRMLPMDAIRRG